MLNHAPDIQTSTSIRFDYKRVEHFVEQASVHPAHSAICTPLPLVLNHILFRIMRHYYLLTLISLCWRANISDSSPIVSDLLNSDKIAQILTLASNFTILNQIPGLGISVVYKNNVTGDMVIAEGIGQRDVALQLEANNKTLFPLGSNSKGFSATMIIKILHEKFPELGESVLDTPIKKLVPTFDFVLSDRYRTEFVTFRDIFAMRVCITSSGGLSEIFAAFLSKEEFYYRLRYYNETCSFRNGYEYSNALYGFAGEIAAHISNSTVEEIIIDFMKELGMNDSSFFDTEGRYETLPNIAKAYYKRFGTIHQFDNKMLKRTSAAITAGGIMVTQEDMVKYMNFHLNKGKVGDRQVIPEKVLSWLYTIINPKTYMTQQSVGRKMDKDGMDIILGYGLGHLLSLHDGYLKIGHGGFYPPYNSQFGFFPDLNIAMFTVSNGPGPTGSETGFTHEALQNHIYNILRGDVEISSDLNKISARTPPVLPGPFSNEFEHKWMSQSRSQEGAQELSQSSKRLSESDLVGLYGNADTGDIVIHESEDHLFMDFGEYATNGIMERMAGSSSTFSIQWTTSIMHDFYIYGDLFVPKFAAHFINENEFQFEFGSNIKKSVFVTFQKNATIDTFPKIPWREGDCGPNQI